MKNSLIVRTRYMLDAINLHIHEEKEIFWARKNKDRYILGDKNRKTNLNGVNLHYWKPHDGGDNLGDYLSTVVCDYLCEINRLPSNVISDKARHLYAVGSILGFGCQDAVVWGSGVLEPCRQYEKKIMKSALDVRCVRGPKTREYLLRLGVPCPEKYGDPVILMPHIYNPKIEEKKYRFALIPHMWDTTNSHENSSVCVLDMKTTNYRAVISEILKSEIVISSSLHGLILAEAYGIPAIYLKSNQNDFKYEDYYLSTGREMNVVAHSISQAMELEPPCLPNFNKIEQDLLETFPVDLWR